MSLDEVSISMKNIGGQNFKMVKENSKNASEDKYSKTRS